MSFIRFLKSLFDRRSAERLFRKGLDEYERREYARAQEIFSQVVEDTPDHVDAHFYSGLCSVFSKDFEGARKSLLTVLEYEPGHFGAHANLGTLYVKMGELDLAISCYQKALDLATGQRGAIHYFMANTFARKGNHAKALPHYLEAVEREPEDLDIQVDLISTFYRLKRWSEVRDLADKILRSIPDNEGVRGQREIADLILKRTISEESLPYFERGLVAYGRNRFGEARKNFEAAVELSPSCSLYHHCLGTTHDLLGDSDEAFDEYLIALREDPSFYRAPEAHTNMAAIYGKKGMFQEAKEACQRAIAMKPDYAMAFANLGSAQLGLGAWDDAREASLRAIELDDENVVAHTSLAFVYYEQGDLHRASEHLEIAETLGASMGPLKGKIENLKKRIGYEESDS